MKLTPQEEVNRDGAYWADYVFVGGKPVYRPQYFPLTPEEQALEDARDDARYDDVFDDDYDDDE